MASNVMIYGVPDHPACIAALQYLKEKGISDIELANVDANSHLRTEMWARSERHVIPQIFVGEAHVGSFSDMVELDQSGELDVLLSAI